jgi:hypothetical protein
MFPDYFYWSMIISMVIILQRFLSTISTYILCIIRSSVYLKSKKVNQCKRQNGNYAIYSFVALVSNDCSILNNDCIHYFYFFLKMFQLLLNIVWFIMKKYMQVFYSFKKRIASKSVEHTGCIWQSVWSHTVAVLLKVSWLAVFDIL